MLDIIINGTPLSGKTITFTGNAINVNQCSLSGSSPVNLVYLQKDIKSISFDPEQLKAVDKPAEKVPTPTKAVDKPAEKVPTPTK